MSNEQIYEEQLKMYKEQLDRGILSVEEYEDIKQAIIESMINEKPVSLGKNTSSHKRKIFVILGCVFASLAIITIIIIAIKRNNHRSAIEAQINWNEYRISEIDDLKDEFKEKSRIYDRFVSAYNSYDEDDKYSVKRIEDAAEDASQAFDVSGATLAKYSGDYDDFYDDLCDAYLKELNKQKERLEEQLQLIAENHNLEYELNR